MRCCWQMVLEECTTARPDELDSWAISAYETGHHIQKKRVF
jgi:hypothetical protein